MCYDYDAVTNTCNTNQRISDHYIVAPGRYIAAPDANGEYRTNSGTSMAAPQVSGAVAIIHQMWPHMKGENIKAWSIVAKEIESYNIRNSNLQ